MVVFGVFPAVTILQFSFANCKTFGGESRNPCLIQITNVGLFFTPAASKTTSKSLKYCVTVSVGPGNISFAWGVDFELRMTLQETFLEPLDSCVESFGLPSFSHAFHISSRGPDE